MNILIENEFGEEGQDFYIADSIGRKGKEEREVLLKEMGLGGEMTEEDGLAMLVDLGATWNMMRKWMGYVFCYSNYECIPTGMAIPAEDDCRSRLKRTLMAKL